MGFLGDMFDFLTSDEVGNFSQMLSKQLTLGASVSDLISKSNSLKNSIENCMYTDEDNERVINKLAEVMVSIDELLDIGKDSSFLESLSVDTFEEASKILEVLYKCCDTFQFKTPDTLKVVKKYKKKIYRIINDCVQDNDWYEFEDIILDQTEELIASLKRFKYNFNEYAGQATYYNDLYYKNKNNYID